PKLKSMMFKLRSIRLSFLKFLLASNDVFHQSLATAVQLRLMRFMLNISHLESNYSYSSAMACSLSLPARLQSG
ncbi:hypothetical protein, partial [Klebsiella pneumoniae]|uniref:hypothetical protein n=2 Tax=Klebsiella pneumoniae TaxID=573 RepID=UPI001968E8D6